MSNQYIKGRYDMADLKMPEINHVVISGNLTRDPLFRKTPNGGSLVTFTIAANKRYRDGNNERKEEVYFIHIFALNRLAETCSQMLKKGYAVLLEGELISRKNSVNSIEVKARRIQFLTRSTGFKNGKKPDIDANDENTDDKKTPSNNEDDKPISLEDD
jgi:single-strand DNA-binding protein